MIPCTKGKKDNIGTQTPVMPAGSSWVICDSKSRPGFKYFFNTESGEAVWNLNNKDQIEKAKKQTLKLHTKLGKVPELPEPQDQPPMNARSNLNLPMSNYCNFLNMGARSFNGNVWTNPPGVVQQVQQPQIVLMPTVAPMLNPSIGNNNLHPTLALQNILPFTYQSYGDFNVPYNNSNHRGRTFYNNKQSQRPNVQNSTNYRQGGGDLRQKLARKRNVSESNFSNSHDYKQEYYNSNDSEENSLTNESCEPEFSRFEAEEEIQRQLTADTIKLDDCYVVVDKDIILSEFVFFDNLVSNDPNFRLVVPHHVMSELKTDACKNSEARVRRIVRFLSQKIESNLIYLGEEIKENYLQNWDKTFITCEKFVENHNKNVILVSKNNETWKFKGNNDKIEIISLCKFKEVVSNAKAKFSSPTRAIKIIIPNNLKIDGKTNSNDNIREATDVERKGTNVERKATIVGGNETNVGGNVTNVERKATNVEGNATNAEGNATNVERKATNVDGNVTNVERKVVYVGKKDTSSQPILSPLSKQTVDSAVQTEVDTEVNKIRCNFSDTNIEVDTAIGHENTTKKREIRLNRTTPMKKAKIEETSTDKKQFKWRKNRATNSNNSELTQTITNIPTETTTNIAPKIIMNADKDIIPNVTESKQKDTNQTHTKKSFVISKRNSVMSIDREQVKTTSNFLAEKNTKIHEDILRQTSTEDWIESLPYSKSDTDKDSRSSSRRSVNKTNSTASSQAYNVNSIVHKVSVKPVNKNIVLKNVEMITIAGPSMEEVLRMRSDEWVSRFVQIMEEILNEKLQEDPPFQNDEYPPPWNLHEAARCIIKKYSNYFNVVNAANKLSFILYKISDDKEIMPLNLQPSDFMEMYSYGIYLVETLQDVSGNCDTHARRMLHVAKELLKTLLYDIQNPNMETSCSDVFGNGLQESYTTSTDITESDFRTSQEQSTPKKPKNRAKRTNANKKAETESLYTTRSSKKTSEIPEVTQSKSSNINNKANFLSNLKLTTKSISSPSTVTSPAYSNLTIRSPVNSLVKSPLPVLTKFIDNKHDNDTSNNKEQFQNDEEIVSSSGQPNFVRNFQICPEFEARIDKARSILELNDCDEPYSDDDDDDCEDDGFHFDMSQPRKCTPNDNTFKDVLVQFDDNSNKKEFKKFKWYIGDSQLRIIKDTFADVIDNLPIIRPNSSKIEESKSIAIKLFPRIENIYNHLDNILKKNVYYGDANIKETLKNVNADSTEEDMFCLQYRNTITQFRDQAYIIIRYLKLILSTS